MEFFETVEQFAWIGWIVLIALCLVIEMLTLDFTFLMLSLGSVAGLVSDLAGAPLWLQVVIAGIVALLLILVIRPPLLKRLRRGEDPTPSNVEALYGMGGIVVASVSAHGGQVRLANGDIWTARRDGAADLTPGTAVTVARIDGATAVVRSNVPLTEEGA